MVQEVSAGDGVFEVEVRRVAFSAKVYRTVNAALGANRVRPFHWDDAEDFDLVPGLGQLHCCHKSGESSADDDHCSLCCHCYGFILRGLGFGCLGLLAAEPVLCGDIWLQTFQYPSVGVEPGEIELTALDRGSNSAARFNRMGAVPKPA